MIRAQTIIKAAEDSVLKVSVIDLGTLIHRLKNRVAASPTEGAASVVDFLAVLPHVRPPYGVLQALRHPVHLRYSSALEHDRRPENDSKVCSSCNPQLNMDSSALPQVRCQRHAAHTVGDPPAGELAAVQ